MYSILVNLWLFLNVLFINRMNDCRDTDIPYIPLEHTSRQRAYVKHAG